MTYRLWLASSVALVLSSPTAAAQPSTFPSPSPEQIEDISRQRQERHVWVVMTPTRRYRVHVGMVDAQGLADFSGPDAAAAPTLLRWDEISGIDRRETRRTAGMAIGAAIGIGTTLFATETLHLSNNPLAATVIGGLAGGFVGGTAGSMSGREFGVYRARPIGTHIDTTMVSIPHSKLDHVRAYRGDLVWVRGTFGQFVGRVGSIESDGLAELRPEGSQDVTLPMEPIPWSQISSIERRGRHTLRGALIGGAIIGGFGAGLGALWGSLGDAGSIAQGTLYGSALGGAVGALAGTILGAPFKGWHRVYSAPSVERTQSDEDE